MNKHTITTILLILGITISVFGQNQIVAENQLRGDSDWTWTGSISDNLSGFTDDISSNKGGLVNFKVKTDSTSWNIDIYRIGYYGGLGARKVAALPQSAPSFQPVPVTDLSTGLVDAGNWSISASWVVPADAVSGLYIAKLSRAETGDQFVIPFVIRDDNNYHDVIFKTSDTTWIAYTGWGGYNFYGTDPGAVPLTSNNADGRAYKVSYNRPISSPYSFGTYSGPQDSWVGVEIAAIHWLEKNGYDVAYQASVDTDRYGVPNCRIFLSVGHDEYWTIGERANVEAARDAGVNLAFWSGNECFWRCRWEDNYRTLVCYKETRSNAHIDPADWTGTWRDPRFFPEYDENAMSGQLFMVDDSSPVDMYVPPELSNHPFWRNTSIAGVGGSVAIGCLGYEWDECPDNAFTPPGLVRLSLATYNVSTYMFPSGYGATDGSGTATHSLSLYQAASGAWVFGAGSVFWVWALDDNHDYSKGSYTPPDSNVQQAMVNLFGDMGGVLPGTLQPGLVNP
jgi:hypothetical protein